MTAYNTLERLVAEWLFGCSKDHHHRETANDEDVQFNKSTNNVIGRLVCQMAAALASLPVLFDNKLLKEIKWGHRLRRLRRFHRFLRRRRHKRSFTEHVVALLIFSKSRNADPPICDILSEENERFDR